MKNKGKIIVRKIMLAVFGLSAGMMIQSPESSAVDNAYETAEDALYATSYKDIFYNKTAGSPLEYEPEDGVDTATGHLVLQRTDMSLTGTGGMDFELNRYYDSNEANIGHPTVEHVEELDVENINISFQGEDGKTHTFVVSVDIFNNHSDALEDMFIEYEKGEEVRDAMETDTQRTKIISNENYNVYGISSGWSYDFPWIETMSIQDGEDSRWDKKPIYLHYGSKGNMAVSTTADEETRSYAITGLEDYGYSDIKLEDFSQTVDGIKCRYLLRDKTGLRTYFNSDGVVVLQKDAHDNAITYTYQEGIYFDTITDSVGRKITFQYGEESNGQRFLEKVSVQGQAIAGGVTSQTVKYTISEKSYTPKNGKKIYGSVLNSATVDGTKETYKYRTVETFVNTSGWRIAAHRADTNQAYLIKSVTCDGGVTNYEYRAGTIRGTKDAAEGQGRDIATQFYYVTREYQQDESTGKKANGTKYDYFQKQKGESSLVSFADGFDETDAQQYGEDGLRTVTVVSTYNPKKHKDNGLYSDYTYKKSKINAGTLGLKNATKKNVSIYIYNENKLLTEEVSYGKEKEETLYTYDNSGKGSLVTLETEKSYGSKGSKAATTKQGYTYDRYRNILAEKSSKAYLAKNKGKEYLFTTTYTYQGTDKGYPEKDVPYTLCTLLTEESYTAASTKSKLTGVMAANGVDYASILEQRSVGGGAYKTISKTDFQYDSQGNEIQGQVYPSYSVDGEKEAIQNNYTYNRLGQQTKQTVSLASAKNPTDNRTYTEEEVTYDSFGNELSYTDEKGLVTKSSYDPETGEETETINAAGTEYETTEQEYISEDSLKTMSIDAYGRVSIDIDDAFGNTIISKDEAAGIWTESTYDYGSEDGESTEEDADLEEEETARLIQEITYTFNPSEEAFITDETGESLPNYDMAGKGETILSGARYFYDDLGNEVGSAEFSNGSLDAAHCSSWSFSRSETEVTGEEDEVHTISTSYSKELNPAKYQSDVDTENYYDQFNSAVLTETITETVTDIEGNTVSTTSTTIREGNRAESVTTNESDDFGRTTKENTVTKNYQDGVWLPAYETQTLYSYDDSGNVSQIDTKSRKEGEAAWETRTVKTDYDDQGQVTKEYTPRGVKENAPTKYEYDILGRMIQSELPQEKENGAITYQTTTTQYDTAGNVTAKEEQIDDDRTAKTEYTYDKLGNLVMVKSSLEDGTAQYVQYVYDTEGNKVRQFTGMTSPLTLTVSEITGDTEGTDGNGSETGDTFSYVGKTYSITISGKKKSDTIRETRYEYDGKNQLISYTDPEGRTETYTYDVYSNLTKTVDKNGNTQKNTYDYQNRLTEMVAKEQETGTRTAHTYTYNAYGDVAAQDDTFFTYGDVSGQVTEETMTLAGNQDVVKTYTYDSEGNQSAFTVTAGGRTQLSLRYTYDGESKLVSVTDGEGKEVVAYDYDTEGNLAERTVAGDNLITTYAYDYQNHLTAMSNKNNSGMISEYTSEYLLNGQKSEETAAVRDGEEETEKKTATYTYDLLGRLSRETKTGSEDITYTYDSNNNRKDMTTGNQVISYKYNKNDELLRTDTLNTDTKEDSVVLYKNDKNGNQLATVNRYDLPGNQKEELYADLDITLGDNRLNENVVRRYNALNQLTQTLTKNYKVSYTYDAEGLRTSKTVNGETTFFIWDGDQLVLELKGDGEVQKRYIRGDDLVYADQGEDTEKQYYVTDSHGNVVQLTDEEGTVTKTYEYDSFGIEVKPDKKDDNPFRYCGEYYDKETEEIYLRARYYEPSEGRFLTRDTYTGEEDEPESLHLYTYCGNDGVNAWDPSGHISLKGIWNKVKQGTKKVIKTGSKIVKTGVRYVANKWRYSSLGKYFASATASGKYKKIMNAFDFYQDADGVYHTSQNCWQKLGGYNDLYDFFFDAATEMKAIKFNLPTNTRRFNLNKTYILWAWKGDYFNLGAGGEMGIYSNYIKIHSLAETKNSIYSKLQVFYRGKKIIKFKPSSLCWWITGFNPKFQNIKTADDLSLKCKADFSNVSKDLRKAFFKKAKTRYGKYWKVNKKKKTATFKW